MMTYIGIAALIAGMILICAGWNSGARLKVVGVGVLIVIAGALIGIGGNPAKDMPNGSPSMVACGFIMLAGAGVMVAQAMKKEKVVRKKAARDSNEYIGATVLDRFFVECVLAGMNDFSKEKNVQRAKMLADKYKLEYPDGIEALYLHGLEGHKVVSQRYYLEKINQQRTAECNRFDELNKYSDLSGKDKRITMLQEKAAILRKDAKTKREFADMLVRSGQQKEIDWAVMGGIADGIAGFGAGVSTAVDAQIRNAQIREENEIRLKAAMPAYMDITGKAGNLSKSADSIAKEIEEYKMKLTSDEPKEALLEKIKFTNTIVYVSETGAATVSTKASLDPNFMIFGDVPAIVDGTVLAHIYEGEELRGTAQLVLPMYGLGQNQELQGMCLDCCEVGKEYDVKFEAKSLSAIEK